MPLISGHARINARCNAVAGHSVQQAVLNFTFKKHGKTMPYQPSDLRYDIKCILRKVINVGGSMVVW